MNQQVAADLFVQYITDSLLNIEVTQSCLDTVYLG